MTPTPVTRSATTLLVPTLAAAMLDTGWEVMGGLAQVSHGTQKYNKKLAKFKITGLSNMWCSMTLTEYL